MADRVGFTEFWGEIEDPWPKTPIHQIEISEPKPAEYEVPALHQPSSEHFPPKDELPARLMDSVKPPLDKHSQNLTLHCIELQHHKRRMRLMLMAAQHQYGEGGKMEGFEASSLPAPPSRPNRFCSSQGIVTPPTQSTILSRAQESYRVIHSEEGLMLKTLQEPRSFLCCAELDSVSNRHLIMKVVATVCAKAGFEMACESTLEILTDILDDFNKRFCRLLRTAVDNEALNGNSGFPNAVEYALHEIGLGGCAAIHKYWLHSVQDYIQRLDQEDQEMVQEYKSLVDPTAKASLGCEEGSNTLGHIVKEEPDAKGGGMIYRMLSGKDMSEQGSELTSLSPYGMAANGNTTGEGNSDPTSPQWAMNYIKAGGDEEPYDDPMTVVPTNPQST